MKKPLPPILPNDPEAEAESRQTVLAQKRRFKLQDAHMWGYHCQFCNIERCPHDGFWNADCPDCLDALTLALYMFAGGFIEKAGVPRGFR